MNWYIVQAYSGFENKVAENIKDVMAKNALEFSLGEVLVPTHKVTEAKERERIPKNKNTFPGYVLVKLDLSIDIYHKIKNIQKVSGFLLSGRKTCSSFRKRSQKNNEPIK